MKSQILSLVARRQYVSFAELSREIPGFQGDHEMCDLNFPNVIVWPQVSPAGIIALKELLESEQLFMHAANPLVYAVDQMIPRMPLARGLKAYKSPRWLPVTFCTKPHSTPRKRAKKVR